MESTKAMTTPGKHGLWQEVIGPIGGGAKQ
jgi:hypothetical protein